MSRDVQYSSLSECPRCRMKSLRCGEKIDSLIEAADLTRGEVARISGVPEKTLDRICRGENAPSIAHFYRLMAVLLVRQQRPFKFFKASDFEEYQGS